MVVFTALDNFSSSPPPPALRPPTTTTTCPPPPHHHHHLPFPQQLENITVPGYVIKKTKTGDYFYLLPQRPPTSSSPLGSTSDIRNHFSSAAAAAAVDDLERSKTPPISHISSLATHHRRAASCGNPIAHSYTPSVLMGPPISVDFGAGREEGDKEEAKELPHFWLIFHTVVRETGGLDMGLFFHVRWVCLLSAVKEGGCVVFVCICVCVCVCCVCVLCVCVVCVCVHLCVVCVLCVYCCVVCVVLCVVCVLLCCVCCVVCCVCIVVLCMCVVVCVCCMSIVVLCVLLYLHIYVCIYCTLMHMYVYTGVPRLSPRTCGPDVLPSAIQ